MAEGHGEHPTMLNIDCHLTSRRMQGNLRSSIFRIPSMLKMQNEWAYTPHAFDDGYKTIQRDAFRRTNRALS
ncbi:hypothetical protein SLE2022_281960 [Rubroshorea leprosula]